MRFSPREGARRGRLSLRSRLLAGLIAITALFLIVMGVVTTVVIGHSEQNQFNTDLLLTAKSTPRAIQGAGSDYVAVDAALGGRITPLTPPSGNLADLEDWFTALVAQREAFSYLTANNGQVFTIRLP